jgi:hypothetical protein
MKIPLSLASVLVALLTGCSSPGAPVHQRLRQRLTGREADRETEREAEPEPGL